MQQLTTKIGYWIFNYQPQWEAASKEIEVLLMEYRERFNTHLVSLNFRGRKICLRGSQKYLPAPFAFVALPLLQLFAASLHINHLFTSPGERILLPRLSKYNTLLTITKDTDSFKAIEKNIVHLRKLPYIIVESAWHRELLLQVGIAKQVIKLIYPGMRPRPYHAAPYPFKILFATSPLRKYDLLSRGVHLLARVAQLLPNIDFILVWRQHDYHRLRALLDSSGIGNIHVINGYVPDMESLYASAHAVILPGLSQSSLKPCPHSALHSLAHGKPLLVSYSTSIAGLIRQKTCGVVFEPTVESLQQSILELMANYDLYQSNCHRVLQENFSEHVFFERYQNIYESML